MLKKNMSFLLEKLPMPFYPLDEYFCRTINDQKTNIFNEVGLDFSMEPVIDENGVTYLPSTKKRVGAKVFRFPAMLGELKDYEHCRKCLEPYISGAKEKMKRLAQLDFGKLDLNGCADELEGLIKLEQKLCYGRFKYALFPAFFTNGSLTKLLKKIDKELTSDDLYGGLEYKTAMVSRDIAALARAITGDPELRRDIENGMTYEEVRTKYPSMAALFDEFMKTNGYKLDFNCYCIYSRSFIEAPQRLMGIIRPLIGVDNSLDDGAEKFTEIMSKLEKLCGAAKFEKVKGTSKNPFERKRATCTNCFVKSPHLA